MIFPVRMGDWCRTSMSPPFGRQPEAGATEFWRGALQGSPSLEPLTVGVLAAPEYYGRHGGDAPHWLTSLYADVLGRTPDAVGLSFWDARLRGSPERAPVHYYWAVCTL